jgi:hypothetical protein
MSFLDKVDEHLGAGVGLCVGELRWYGARLLNVGAYYPVNHDQRIPQARHWLRSIRD